MNQPPTAARLCDRESTEVTPYPVESVYCTVVSRPVIEENTSGQRKSEKLALGKVRVTALLRS